MDFHYFVDLYKKLYLLGADHLNIPAAIADILVTLSDEKGNPPNRGSYTFKGIFKGLEETTWYDELFNLIQEAMEYAPEFGAHLGGALTLLGKKMAKSKREKDVKVDMAALASAFMMDMVVSNIQVFEFHDFDALTNADQAMMRDFFIEVAKLIPDYDPDVNEIKVKLIVSAREVPHRVWKEPFRAGYIQVVNDENYLGEPLYNLDTLDHVHIEIRFFGQTVKFGGATAEDWQGPLPRNLFLFMMYQMIIMGFVTRDIIFEIIWPKLVTREAVNVFHVTKRKISELISALLGLPIPEEKHRRTRDEGDQFSVYKNLAYRLPTDDPVKGTRRLILHCDLKVFIDANAQITAINEHIARVGKRDERYITLRDEAINYLILAINTYNDEFLYGMEEDWIDAPRRELHQEHVKLLKQLYDLLIERGETEQAFHYLTTAFNRQPAREDIARLVIQACHELDNDALGWSYYGAHAQALRRINPNMTPARSTQKLYDDYGLSEFEPTKKVKSKR